MKWQQQLTLTLLLSGVVGLVLVYLISYIISRRITRRLRRYVKGLVTSPLAISIIVLSSSHTMRLDSSLMGLTGGARPEVEFRGAYGGRTGSNMARCRTAGGT